MSSVLKIKTDFLQVIFNDKIRFESEMFMKALFENLVKNRSDCFCQTWLGISQGYYEKKILNVAKTQNILYNRL